jgi:hypothetical protein
VSFGEDIFFLYCSDEPGLQSDQRRNDKTRFRNQAGYDTFLTIFSATLFFLE